VFWRPANPAAKERVQARLDARTRPPSKPESYEYSPSSSREETRPTKFFLVPQPTWTAFLRAINTTKKDLLRSADDADAAERLYSPFLVNRALAQFADTIFLANAMNLYPQLPRLMQHDFLLHAVPVGNRTPKRRPHSRVNEDDVELVERHFNYSRQKALQALKILTNYQLAQLREHYTTGG
jgi:hypothetical protein